MRETTYPRLPFWKTVRDSYVLTGRHAGTFARYAWPALMLLVLAQAVLYWATFPAEMRMRADSAEFSLLDMAAPLAPMVLSMLVGAMVAVPWHRFMIEENHDPRALDGSPFARRTLVYFLYVLAGIVPVLIAAVPSGILAGAIHSGDGAAIPYPEMAVAAVFILALTPFFRFSLVYPARAVGNTTGLWNLFALTRGNALRLAAGTLFVTLPSILLAFGLEGWSPTQAQDRSGYVMRSVTFEAVSMIAGMTIVTFLSLAYRHFVIGTQRQASVEP